MLNVREVDVNELKPWEDNPRDNDAAVDAVARSISSFGFNVPILCDTDLTIVAGHTRWKAARKMGLARVPVIVLDLSDAQRRAFAIADNKTADLAVWNYEGLKAVLEALKSDSIDLASLGFTETELEALLTEETTFDWDSFDAAYAKENEHNHVLLHVKVPAGIKADYTIAIEHYAKLNRIEGKDPAVIAGKVIGHLLGLRS